MIQGPIISLCIPTNGISEWVFPVLDSIYAQGVDDNLFEVVVTNNGENEMFHNSMMEMTEQHSNLIYQKTDAFMFHNQLEALKLANGCYLKFINHRNILKDGALNKLIQFIQDNMNNKPTIYFSNGALGKDYRCKSFDEFVDCLGIFASWTTGVGIWREEYLRIPKDVKIDNISPHSAILFSEKNKTEYIITDFVFAKDIDSSHEKKGKYDLFKAFAIEEFTITLNLYLDGYISSKTLKSVKDKYEKCVSEFYYTFCIKKEPCSYDLTGFDEAMGIFFQRRRILFLAYKITIKKKIRKLFHF